MMCCYYPTTTVAIDDDIDFLTVLTQHLGIADCLPYSSPRKAIAELDPQTPFQRIQSRIMKTGLRPEDNSSPDDHAVFFNMRGLHEEIYNKDRFHDVSVLIVDYQMDGMSGLEVCQALSNHPAKKILLTGGINKETLVIEAFNKGIIHRFINKSDANFPNKLKHAITVLKDAYFRDLSSTLLPHITTMPMTLYQNPIYINFIKNRQEQFNAVECYMIDTIGTSLMIDAHGEPIWLIIKHEADMDAHEKLAYDQEAHDHLIQGIANRSLMPFFFSDEAYQKSASEWGRFFYPCQDLPSIKNYYYAICRGHQANHLYKDKIISYTSHCQSKD
jgi:CheY-like chemotaxis protein